MESLLRYRALILLGEPGIGKTTALADETERVKELASSSKRTVIHADLRAYSSEGLLYKQLFESPEFLAWLGDDSELDLHLDSLDEALLRIDSIANLLANELPRLPVAQAQSAHSVPHGRLAGRNVGAGVGRNVG